MPESAAVYDLRTEHLINPLGLDEPRPRLSWKIADPRFGAVQRAWQVQAATEEEVLRSGRPDLWDSGKVANSASVLISYQGPGLQPHSRHHWRVRIWDQNNRVSRWSEPAWFETGFLSPDVPWPKAKWIGLTLPASDLQPVRHLRTAFQIDRPPTSARLYITARGVFEPWVNGQRVGRDSLVPGWTDYAVRIEYLTYDVGEFLRPGDNCLGALIGDGWYAGYLCWNRAGKGHRYYGEEPALLAVLRLAFSDGSVRWLGSDPSWKGSTGPVRHADLYHGEFHDARKEWDGWSSPSFNDKGWKKARTISFRKVSLNGKATLPIRACEELSSRKVTEPAPGRYVFDLGQNMVGVARLRVRAARGTKITLRFGEMLNEDGTIYTENLRSARCTDTYVTRGTGWETWQPRFTFHGFRYVELTGLRRCPRTRTITGVVLHTEMEATGHFSTSHPQINQLQSNIRWGQRGNFLEIPTDCPQRDERLGWTGDAQVFVTTASGNYHVAGFFRKWMRDVTDGQLPSGAYPDVAPNILQYLYPNRPGGNAAWADAGVICPWVIYQQYGDERILRDNFSGMLKWIAYQEKTATDYIRPETAFGDWLAPDAVRSNWGATPCDLIGTAYFAYTTRLTAKIGRILGYQREAKQLDALERKIVKAFNRQYVTQAGRIAGDSQTAYLLALGFDLLPKSLREPAVGNLVRTLERRDHHLATGFVGTPLLCPVLSRFGRTDLAYRLLFNQEYPSWLYPVKNGATTMWERWNSWTPEKGFGEAGMNSFNHYAYGAIGEWLYRTVAGIDLLEPGFRRILLKPEPGGLLTAASGTLDTPYGLVQSAWKLRYGRWAWEMTVPPNTSARIVLPVCVSSAATINGKALSSSSLRNLVKPALPSGVFDVPAGRYLVTAPVRF